MIRVKVSVPEIDTPFFDGKVDEENYAKFKCFLDELTDEYGEGNVKYSAEVDESDDSEKECAKDENTIAEYIKDHPIVSKNMDSKVSKINDDIDKDLKDIFPDKDICELEDVTNEVCINVKVHYTLNFISEIFAARNQNKNVITPENVIDNEYDIIDSVSDIIDVKVPTTVIKNCTNVNISKFIMQSVVFQLLDKEYYDVDDEHLNECFTKDFDDSYCYDTGVLSINFDFVENKCCHLEYMTKMEKACEELVGVSMDYREMEKLYIQLRKV